MDDDFDTPEAVAVLFELANEVNRGTPVAGAGSCERWAGCWASCSAMRRRSCSQAVVPDRRTSEIEALIDARLAARKAKNFAEADRIRRSLADAGVVLEDAAGGTTWRRVS